MTKLLVSVRNAWEAGEAWSGGAAVIDVKEPRRGSLGAASPEARDAVRQTVQQLETAANEQNPLIRRTTCLSAALGELLEQRAGNEPARVEGFRYAKVGLAGCGDMVDWEQSWRCWMANLPESVAPVAVVYADYRSANAPHPWRVIEVAVRSPARTLLIDTYDKTAGGVLQRMTGCELAEVIDAAHESGLQVALAGSITLDCLDDALRYEPDWIAVRGGVCRGCRDSILARQLVERFVERLSTPRPQDAAPRCNQTIDSAFYGT